MSEKIVAPTLPTALGSLPPEGAHLAKPQVHASGRPSGETIIPAAVGAAQYRQVAELGRPAQAPVGDAV